MVHILTSTITPRLRYVAHLLFNEILGVDAVFTTSEADYQAIPGPKFRYGGDLHGNGPRMPSSGLLNGSRVEVVDVPVDTTREVPVLFPSGGEGDPFPFDLFSATFYLVSRYEEYLQGDRDRYQRFPATASLAWRYGFLDKPVVNIWLDQFVRWFQQHEPGFQPHMQAYRYLPTLDIDHAYAYRFRSFKRTVGGTIRSLLSLKPMEVMDRFRVLMSGRGDPFDTYAWVKQLHDTYDLSTTWFILTAADGGDDNNISPECQGFRQLVSDLQSWSAVGLHPSLSSFGDPGKLASEVALLSGITGAPVQQSRQHFLRFSLPATYRELIDAGITDEYSMGYASHPGFRAGIAHPFFFYDLTTDAVLRLKIHPLPLMDVTFRDYLGLTPEKALMAIKQIVDAVRLSKGELITLWHNESLSDQGRWKGWRGLYTEVVRMASER